MAQGYAGKICSKHPELNGHRIKGGHCPICNIERVKAWRLANPERSRLNNKLWTKANPEKNLASHKKYRDKVRDQELIKQRIRVKAWRQNPLNREKRLAQKERYYRKHYHDLKPKFLAASRRRQIGKTKATPKWANDFFIKEIYHLSALRTRMLGYRWNVDHIVPLKSPIVCGLHVDNNLQVIPEIMNLRKHNRHWPGMPVGG